MGLLGGILGRHVVVVVCTDVVHQLLRTQLFVCRLRPLRVRKLQ